MSCEKALEKAKRYCSFQERCILDVENRFRAWNVKKEDWDSLIDKLMEQNFLNEKRYIEAFVRGKFLIKKWGKIKIKAELNHKKIYGKEIDEAIDNEIEEDEYFKTIKNLIVKKKALLNESDKSKEKLYRYLLSKGYEQELIFKFI
ncbi:MAG: RecX family transcriptional regulator [Bacteroidetes bacterium]|nr:RecX family transcriptional regulator [Bacteroidota bacterium]